jgi:hypothetical protein
MLWLVVELLDIKPPMNLSFLLDSPLHQLEVILSTFQMVECKSSDSFFFNSSQADMLLVVGFFGFHLLCAVAKPSCEA